MGPSGRKVDMHGVRQRTPHLAFCRWVCVGRVGWYLCGGRGAEVVRAVGVDVDDEVDWSVCHVSRFETEDLAVALP
jgi:hypothetical protein